MVSHVLGADSCMKLFYEPGNYFKQGGWYRIRPEKGKQRECGALTWMRGGGARVLY